MGKLGRSSAAPVHELGREMARELRGSEKRRQDAGATDSRRGDCAGIGRSGPSGEALRVKLRPYRIAIVAKLLAGGDWGRGWGVCVDWG